MPDIFGLKAGQQSIVWFHQNPVLSNHYCLYCGEFVGGDNAAPSDKEHLIARNFVPKGSLGEGAFNFIFRSCRTCNGRKADAERHVSSVTLFNSPGRADRAEINLLAQRKAAGDYHPKKQGVLVKDAGEEVNVSSTFGPAKMSFGFIGPPQLDPDGVHQVATNHIQGLFSLVTTEDPRDQSKSRLLPPHQVRFLGHYGVNDWGNEQLVEVARRVQSWPCYAIVTSANCYFKAIMRRGDDHWFWALEWNKFLRVAGMIALPEERELALFDGLPELKWKAMPDGTGRFRVEVSLSKGVDDLLFCGAVVSRGD